MCAMEENLTPQESLQSDIDTREIDGHDTMIETDIDGSTYASTDDGTWTFSTSGS